MLRSSLAFMAMVAMAAAGAPAPMAVAGAPAPKLPSSLACTGAAPRPKTEEELAERRKKKRRRNRGGRWGGR